MTIMPTFFQAQQKNISYFGVIPFVKNVGMTVDCHANILPS